MAARGTGAHGEFRASKDISDLTIAEVFKPGSVTPVFVLFLSVVHSKHSPETLRDPRGFATKFYTSQGKWNLVGNNLPVFFIRDAIKFPDMVHAFKPDPRTNLGNDARTFDFFSHVPEATHGHSDRHLQPHDRRFSGIDQQQSLHEMGSLHSNHQSQRSG